MLGRTLLLLTLSARAGNFALPLGARALRRSPATLAAREPRQPRASAHAGRLASKVAPPPVRALRVTCAGPQSPRKRQVVLTGHSPGAAGSAARRRSAAGSAARRRRKRRSVFATRRDAAKLCAAPRLMAALATLHRRQAAFHQSTPNSNCAYTSCSRQLVRDAETASASPAPFASGTSVNPAGRGGTRRTSCTRPASPAALRRAPRSWGRSCDVDRTQGQLVRTRYGVRTGVRL